jgi:AraC-like DNA-binding protein
VSSSAATQEAPALPRVIRTILTGLERIGIDAQAVLANCGSSVLQPSLGTPPPAQVYALWEAALAVSGESGLGVRLAERARPEDFGLMGGLVSSSFTLGEALLHGMQFLHSSSRSVQVSLYTDGAQACVAVEPICPSQLHRETVEFILASGVLGARAMTGTDFLPLEVCFSYDPPSDLSHHQRVFRAPLRFGVARTACYFSSALLHLPVRSGDAALKASLAQKAEQQFARAAGAPDLPRRAREAITLELGNGDASCGRVAARLGVHPKALVRRLGAQGMSYRDLVEQVRYELAEQQLRRPEARICDVALLLGYSDKSAFNRAFKRWSGCSPLEYRKRLGVTGAD